MIKRESSLKVTDNSGAKVVQCIGFFKSIKCDTVHLNDIICVCIKKLDKKKFFSGKGKAKIIKKQRIESMVAESKQIYKAIVLSCCKQTFRIDGSFVKTKNNRVVLITEN